MMESFYIMDLELPRPFVHFCEQYSVVTLAQAMELVHRMRFSSGQLPEGITSEILDDVQTLISGQLSPESLMLLQQPLPDFPLNGLRVEDRDQITLDGERFLEDILDKDGGGRDGAEVNDDEHKED